MTAHKRKQSRGSFSIFSLDTIRSLSRAGSRQAARVPSKDELLERAESSLSYRCDPYNQPPPSPTPQAITLKSQSEISPEHQESAVLLAQGSVSSSTGATRARSARHKVSQRLRPLSWLFHQKTPAHDPPYPRSVSAQLPKASSTSTVGRSIISAPTLTSTTNVQVAQTEGVHCGEMSDAAFSQSTWDSQVGWLVQPSAENPRPSGHDCDSRQRQLNQNYGSLDTRTFRGGRMFRLGNALRTRLGRSPLGGRKEPALLSPQSPGLGSGLKVPSSSSPRPDAQRRAEMLNRYRVKEKGSAWSSHIRRKSINNSPGLANTHKDPPLLSGLDDDGDAARTISAQEDGDSAFGSLTRSFASAVDKLDFHTPLPHEMSFLRSKSSFFNIKKSIAENDGHQEVRKPDIGISKIRPPTRTSSLQRSRVSTWVEAPVMAKSRRGHLPTTDILAARKLALEPIVYSTEQKAYIASKAVVGHPRGVHPLRMHPPEKRSSSIMKVPRAETPSQRSEDGSESPSLEDAPIYSPSLGDLSQYARETPPSTKHPKSELRKTVVIDTTPTRVFVKENKHGSTIGGSLRKSGSALSLFSKARTARSADKGPKQGSRTSMLPRTNVVALQPRDINQKISNHEEKAVRKSLSLHFGGLFKRDSHSTLGSSTPRDRSIGFQPTTPSPLRNVTRVRRSQSTAQESPPLIARGG